MYLRDHSITAGIKEWVAALEERQAAPISTDIAA